MTRDRNDMPRKNAKPLTLFAVIAVLSLISLPRTVAADALSSPRVYARGSFVYVVEPQRVVFLSMDTRSSHTLYTAADSQFVLVSAARSGDVIWASNHFGAIIAVNMQTGTIEEFGRGRAGAGGQIDVDRHFLWSAANDTLYRMDLASREWVSIPSPNRGSEVRGLISFNDRVHVVANDAVYVYNPVTGDWAAAPHRDFVLGAGDFHKVGDVMAFTRDRGVYMYDPSKRIWHTMEADGRIRSKSITSERFIVSTENRVYYKNPRYFVLTPQPAIPMLRNIRATTMVDGLTACVVDRGLALFSSPFNFNIVAYPEYVNFDGVDVFAFNYFGNAIMYTGNDFIFYHVDRRLWSNVRVVTRGDVGRQRQQSRVIWDEDGAYVNITEDIGTTASGILVIRQEPSAEYTEEGGFELEPRSPLGNATVNFRTETPDGRILDITIDNGVHTLPPQKGFYYKGLDDDVFDRASFGLRDMGLSASQITPGTLVEGGTAVFSGGGRAENRDRNMISATAGSGFLLSKSRWGRFAFNPSGYYGLQPEANRSIIASSVKMYIDGIPLPETDYIYEPVTGAVRLLRRDKANPTSVIQVSFSERALPEDVYTFEPFPENHFGQYNFVEGAISPRSWLSAQAGVMTLDEGGGDGLSPMFMAGIPVEMRRGANRSLMLRPEVAYDPVSGTHSAATEMGVREGRAFGSYRGLWVTDEFNGVERPAFENRNMSGEHEASVGYDLRDNLRASWHQFHRSAEHSELSHFELRALYTGRNYAPDVEMSASSRFTEIFGSEAGRVRKETVSLRVSDLSSRVLGDMNGIHNVGYDFVWTEYQTDAEERGRTVFGSASVSPTSKLTFTGSGIYRNNPSNYHLKNEINPALGIYARGLPRGLDFSATYSVNAVELRTGGSNVDGGMGVSAYFYPGEYANAMEKFIFYAAYIREMESFAPPTVSPLRYAFFVKDENTNLVIISEEFGVIFFPTENLLLSSINSRYRDFVNPLSYATSERAKMWFKNGSSVESNIQIGISETRLYTYGDAMYEHKWSSAFLTGTGLFGDRDARRKDDIVNYSGGPLLFAAVTKEMSGFIRSVENSHRLRVTAYDNETLKPKAEYTMMFRMKMPPNIALVAEMHTTRTSDGNASGGGGVYLYAGF